MSNYKISVVISTYNTGDFLNEFLDSIKSQSIGFNNIEVIFVDDNSNDEYTLKLLKEFEKADIIISVAPSYWADVPGQFKAFIDRCTPWCNTHEPHASLSKGKKGYSIVLRTGSNMKECERLISTIEHFYGHMEIESVDRIGFCSIEFKEAVNGIKNEIIEFCKKI